MGGGESWGRRGEREKSGSDGSEWIIHSFVTYRSFSKFPAQLVVA